MYRGEQPAEDSNAITKFRVPIINVGISETMEFCWVVRNFDALTKYFKGEIKSPNFWGRCSKHDWFLSFNEATLIQESKKLAIALNLKEIVGKSLLVDVKFGSRLILSSGDENKPLLCEHLRPPLNLPSIQMAEGSFFNWSYPWPESLPENTLKIKFQLEVSLVEPSEIGGVIFKNLEAMNKFKAKLQARDAAEFNKKWAKFDKVTPKGNEEEKQEEQVEGRTRGPGRPRKRSRKEGLGPLGSLKIDDGDKEIEKSRKK